MKNRNCPLLWRMIVVTLTQIQIVAQTTYEPYTFSTLAGTASYGSTDGTGSAARFNRPLAVAVDSAGNIYVADNLNHTIRKLTPAGVVTTLAGLAGVFGSTDGTGSAARFNGPYGVEVDSADNVYVADTFNNTIRKVTPIGVVTTLAGLAGSVGSADGRASEARFYWPIGVAVNESGNIYVADDVNNTIRELTPSGVVRTLAGLAGSFGSTDGTGGTARFGNPYGVAVDSIGNLYVADAGNNSIRKVTVAGVVTTLTGLSSLRYPEGVAFDSTGNLYVSDTQNNTIQKITPAGVVTTLAGLAGSFGSEDGTGSTARFWNPAGLAVDSSGNIYVVDEYNNVVRKVTAAGMVTSIAGLAVRPGSVDGTGSAARFNLPRGVTVDSRGNVYVADTVNFTIRKVTPAGVVTTLAGLAGNPGSMDGTGSVESLDRGQISSFII